MKTFVLTLEELEVDNSTNESYPVDTFKLAYTVLDDNEDALVALDKIVPKMREYIDSYNPTFNSFTN